MFVDACASGLLYSRGVLMLRFLVQIGLTLVLGAGLVWLTLAGLRAVGLEGAVWFWLAFGLGGLAAAQISYLLASFIPAPPPVVREPPGAVQWVDEEEVDELGNR